jgi:hypothetical protein
MKTASHQKSRAGFCSTHKEGDPPASAPANVVQVGSGWASRPSKGKHRLDRHVFAG